MAKNLEELRDELYEAFNTAKEKADMLTSFSPFTKPEQLNAVAQTLQGMAMTASSIVQVEHELAERSGLGDKTLIKPIARPAN